MTNRELTVDGVPVSDLISAIWQETMLRIAGAVAPVEAPTVEPDLAIVKKKAEGLLTIPEAAEWLSVARRTVERQILEGRLPSVRIPGTSLRRVSVNALRDYVAAQEQAVTPRRRISAV